MKIKRALALITAVAILFSMTGIFAEEYADISGHWAETAINDLSNMGIIQGSDGTIRPEDLISRAELVTVLYNMLGATDENGVTEYTYGGTNNGWISAVVSEGNGAAEKFADFDAGKWYVNALKWAVANSIISGYEDNTVKAGNPVTRQEAVVILSRALRVSGKGAITANDAASVAAWAADAVGTFMAKGFLNGDDNGNVNPANNIKRCEAFQLIRNMIGIYITKPGTFNGNYGNKLVIVNYGTPTLKNLDCGQVLIGAKAGLPNADGTVKSKIVIFGKKKMNNGNGGGNSYIGGGSSGGSGGNSGGGSSSKKCTVVFNANGGTFSDEKKITKTVTRGTKFSSFEPSKDPKREGYELVGWFDTQEKAKKANEDNVVERSYTLNGDKTFYAGWKSLLDDFEIELITPVDKSEEPAKDLVDEYQLTETSGGFKIVAKNLKKYRYSEDGGLRHWIGLKVTFTDEFIEAIEEDGEDLRWYLGNTKKISDIDWTGEIYDSVAADNSMKIYFDAGAEELPKYLIFELPESESEDAKIYEIDLSKVTLYDYAEPSDNAAIIPSTATDIFGKNADDLMTDVSLVDAGEREFNAEGTLKYLENYPDADVNGNYLALDIILGIQSTDKVKVTVNGTEEVFEGSQKTILIPVTDGMGKIEIIIDYDGEDTEYEASTYTINTNDLILESPEPGPVPEPGPEPV